MNEDILKKRRKVKKKLLHKKIFTNEHFTSLSGEQIEKMFYLYDKIFFGGQIRKELDKTQSIISFRSSKGEKVAGHCETRRHGERKCTFVIALSMKMFSRLFLKGEKNLINGGILCSSRLDCLQLTIEHEIIHLIMQLWDVDSLAIKHSLKISVYQAHGTAFQCLAKHFFGHTQFIHGMNKSGDATSYLTKEEVKVGQTVEIDYLGKSYLAIVRKLNPKRGKVYVPELNATLNGPYANFRRTTKVAVDPKHAATVLEELTKGKFKAPPPPGEGQGKTKETTKVGDKVAFLHKGLTYMGYVVNRGPKRAGVQVADRGIFRVIYGQLMPTTAYVPKGVSKENFKRNQRVTFKFRYGGEYRIGVGTIDRLNPTKAKVKFILEGREATINVPYGLIIAG